MAVPKPVVGRSVRCAVAACVAWFVVAAASAQAQPVSLGSAESFGILGHTSVTSTGASVVRGDVGVSAGGAVTGFPPGTVDQDSAVHEGDAVAVQALLDADAAFDEIDGLTCPAANNLTGQNLGGKSLAPGVYCFNDNAPLTGTLTLTGAGPWTFQVGGVVTIDANAQVLATGVTTACKGSRVNWQVAGASASVGAAAAVIGNILSQNDVALGAGSTLDGRAIAIDGDLRMAASRVAACSFGGTFPPADPFKVTGGGQVTVPDPDAEDHRRGGRGRATFAFVAIPGVNGGDARGRFLYLNHANHGRGRHVGRMHIAGRVTDIDVVAVNGDGSARTVRVSGVCTRRPACTFSALVEDNGEGHRDDDEGELNDEGEPPIDRWRPRDRLGVVVVVDDTIVEARALRPIARGNIQFHEPAASALTTDVNDVEFGPGSVMSVAVSLDPGPVTTLADAYVVLELPDGQLLSWTGAGLVPGLVPVARGFTPFPFEGVLAQLVVPQGVPPGRYTWLSALAQSGTLNLLTPISETVFTITR